VPWGGGGLDGFAVVSLGIVEVREIKHHVRDFKLQCNLRLSLYYEGSGNDDDDDDDDDDDCNIRSMKS
jgi:hypothetical protein